MRTYCQLLKKNSALEHFTIICVSISLVSFNNINVLFVQGLKLKFGF